MFKNISIVVKSGLCLQCGACYSICSVDAVEIEGGIDCFPSIKDVCTNCGKCLRICPGIRPLNSEEGDPLLGVIENCFLGYSLNQEIRFKASSGGVITSLNIQLLESRSIDGVICLRQSWNSIYKNEAVLIKKGDEIISAAGSRYAPAYVCCGLKDLPLKKGGKYAFVGKPCDIQAIAKYTEIVKDYTFLKIAIFCARTPTMSATKEILKRYDIDDRTVKDINYRGNGWPGFFTVYNYKGELLLKKDYRDVWDNILCKREYFSKRCFFCHDCTGEFADISVGDAWLKELPESSDGHSVVITRSKAGSNYIQECIDKKILFLEIIETDTVKKAQKGLLHNKQNIYIKRFVARFFGEKVPDEKIRYNWKNNHILNSIGIAKYFFSKKFNS